MESLFYLVLQYESSSLYIIQMMEPILQTYTVYLYYVGVFSEFDEMGSICNQLFLCRREHDYLQVTVMICPLLKLNWLGLSI